MKTVSGKKIDLNHVRRTLILSLLVFNDFLQLKEVIKYETEFKVSSKDSVLVAVPVSGWYMNTRLQSPLSYPLYRVTPIIDEIESHTSEYIVERHNIIKNPKRSSIKYYQLLLNLKLLFLY